MDPPSPRPHLLLCAAICILTGCRMSVPVHVWEPPELQSAVGKRVVMTTVAGPKEIAGRVKEKMLTMVPNDRGRSMTILDARSLQSKSPIQLVSATEEEPNDLAVASVARIEGAELLLRGEVIENRYGDPMSDAQTERDSLTVSWSLKSIQNGPASGGVPVTVDTKSALERYPDLALSGSRDDVLTTALVRDSFRLMTPSIERVKVQLEISYMLPGSEDVRQGNLAAMGGKWGEAGQIWSEVLDRYPAQVPAMHNLAIAAVAAQDFSRAKRLARRAIRLNPSSLHQKTLAWVELRQRDYHRAFQLPDPPEGWFVTHEGSPEDAASSPSASTSSSEAVAWP